ncbi:hypothetical protein FB45DRAFT_1051495 [Roridomyces roridus]|uniref:Uncharacterized protein n=1 Tax=Roridomyces roridus TaxID=1738132 RepID=A0AAD7CEB8_9AGAR|nr:hypothetical protein FB45DRAFT_1051495 [Roridomyces roridus]
MSSPRYATFCNQPLSTAFDGHSDITMLSISWVLTSGIPTIGATTSGFLTLPLVDGTNSSMLINASVHSGDLEYDLILGRDWLTFCRQTQPQTTFTLTTGPIQPGKLSSNSSSLLTQPSNVE